MHFFGTLTTFVALAMLDIAHASPQRNGGNNNNNNGQNQNGNNNNNDANNANNGAGGTNLLAANIQDASASDGNPDQGAGQAGSLTDDANFINFCSGKTVTNGEQNTGGSCNGVVMGDIPSQGNMISSIIVNPAPGDNIDADTTFQIQVQTTNLVAGTFTNPQNTYYAAPQQLSGGKVVGHTHVTVQDLGGSLTPNNPPDPSTFAFFLGINDEGNGNGLLSATVDGGLPAGSYRVCTMTSASNHQPVLMPVAQRGAQDDCTKFTVGGNRGGNNSNNQGAGNNQQGNNNNQNAANGQNGNNQQANNNQNGAGNNQQNGAANNQQGNQNQDAGNADAANQNQGQGQNQNQGQGQGQGQGQNQNQNQNQDPNQQDNQNQGQNQNQNQNQGANQGQNQGGGFNRGGRRRHRFSARDFIV